MGAETAVNTRPQRPMVLSANNRKISYRSKNGNIFTIELKNSKAADSLRDNLKKDTVKKADGTTEVANGSYFETIFDTIAMYVEESLEIACFGPYDEALK